MTDCSTWTLDTIKYLGDLQAEVKIRHIGVTNFDVPRMEKMVATGVKIVSNQVQYSLLDQRPENYMVPFCRDHHIQLLPYGVLADGFLADWYLGADVTSVNVDTYSKSKYASVLNERGGWDWFQELLQVLHSVGKRYGVSVSDIAAAWVLSRPLVPAVILGARSPTRIADQVKLFTFDLDDGDLGEDPGGA